MLPLAFTWLAAIGVVSAQLVPPIMFIDTPPAECRQVCGPFIAAKDKCHGLCQWDLNSYECNHCKSVDICPQRDLIESCQQCQHVDDIPGRLQEFDKWCSDVDKETKKFPSALTSDPTKSKKEYLLHQCGSQTYCETVRDLYDKECNGARETICRPLCRRLDTYIPLVSCKQCELLQDGQNPDTSHNNAHAWYLEECKGKQD